MKQLKYLIIFLVFQTNCLGAIMITNGLTHVHTGVAGSVITGKIHVRNDGKKDIRLLIYKQDIVLSCDSSYSYKEIGTNPRSSGNWLKTNVDEKLMLAGEEYDITYVIEVPKNITANGSYYNVIMVESAEPLSEQVQKSGITIGSKIRFSIQMITDVGGNIPPPLEFANVSIQKRENMTSFVKVKLKNEGDYTLKAELNLEIFNPDGEKIKKLAFPIKRLYPGKCSDFELELKDLPKGKYEGVLIANNGKDLFGSNLSIEIE